MDYVFNAMRSMFGSRFVSQWGDWDETGLWLAEVAHLPRRYLELGLGHLRTQVQDAARAGREAWPPQPVEFAALCEPTAADLGMPDVTRAWQEANDHAHDPAGHRWSHEAVRLAGYAIGWRVLHETSDPGKRKALGNRFNREYQALVNRVMAGDQLVPRALLESDRALTPAELAVRAGEEKAAKLAEEHKGPAGIAGLRAALGRG
ncbi:replication protein P [Kushneria sp. Sum13]|uniref:replication protein P n=1 Tax=Kushneria sp. Sum13 TaxID=3459196 RepID=UPI004045FE9A